LVDGGSSGIYFKVLPRYKYRHQGEKIINKDQIVLLNVKTNLYLHISYQKDLEVNIPGIIPDNEPKIPDRRERPTSFA